MKRASISEAKNTLSALIDRVRHGEAVVIEDRGIPVARLEPLIGAAGAEGRTARLERQGIVRPPARPLPDGWLDTAPPVLLEDRSGSAILLAERGEGR